MTNVATLQTAADLSASITAQGVSSLVPAGVVMAFAGATAPTGWLLCNGSAISRSTYADLFAAIGVAHGYGDNSTTFNLPNYSGRFLRGRANGSANDPDRASRTAAATGGNTGDAVGSVQGNATAKNSLSGTIGGGGHSHGSQGTWGYDGGGNTASSATPLSFGLAYQAGNTGSHSHTLTITGDNETRPLNAYVNYIIKI